MRKATQESAFNIELPHTIRHLVMKRGYLLRGQRTRSLMCIKTGGASSWLEAKLVQPKGKNSNKRWELAHNLTNCLQRELGVASYIEPVEHGCTLANKVQGGFSPTRPFNEFGKQSDFIDEMLSLGQPDSSDFIPHVPGLLSRHGRRSIMKPGDGFEQGKRDRSQMSSFLTKTFPQQHPIEFSASLLKRMENFDSLGANKQRMFIAETAEVLSLSSFTQNPEMTLAELSVDEKISPMLRKLILEGLSTAFLSIEKTPSSSGSAEI